MHKVTSRVSPRSENINAISSHDFSINRDQSCRKYTIESTKSEKHDDEMDRNENGTREKENEREFIDWICLQFHRSGYISLGKLQSARVSTHLARAINLRHTRRRRERLSIRSEAWLVPKPLMTMCTTSGEHRSYAKQPARITAIVSARQVSVVLREKE